MGGIEEERLELEREGDVWWYGDVCGDDLSGGDCYLLVRCIFVATGLCFIRPCC